MGVNGLFSGLYQEDKRKSNTSGSVSTVLGYAESMSLEIYFSLLYVFQQLEVMSYFWLCALVYTCHLVLILFSKEAASEDYANDIQGINFNRSRLATKTSYSFFAKEVQQLDTEQENGMYKQPYLDHLKLTFCVIRLSNSVV